VNDQVLQPKIAQVWHADTKLSPNVEDGWPQLASPIS
jgi:hypothetical protein